MNEPLCPNDACVHPVSEHGYLGCTRGHEGGRSAQVPCACERGPAQPEGGES